jgi:hypothetical protein
MNNILNIASDFVSGISKILVALLGLGIVAQLVFGNTLIIGDVVANITALVSSLGESGLVGLIVAIIVISLLSDNK